MDIIKIATRKRGTTGKSYSRKARQQGWIPAVYYGHGIPSEKIEVNAHDFAAIVRDRKTSHLVDLGLEEEGNAVAIIKEIQPDILREGLFVHVDFQHVKMDEKIHVHVRLEIIGTPVGVSEEGGIFEHPVKEVLVECLPMNIPEKISVDVSGLKMGDSIHVRDLQVSDAEITASPDEVVATVTHPRIGVEETPAEEGEEGVEGAEGESAAAEGASSEDEPKSE